MGAFRVLNNSTEVKDVLAENKEFTSIILWKPVQSGKTSDVLKLAEVFYKTSALIFISDKNTALAGQTNGRARSLGFEVVNYRDGIGLGHYLREAKGKRKILHLLMEVNNLQKLESTLGLLDDLEISVFIDEADKSRNTIDANEKKRKKDAAKAIDPDDDEDEEEEEEKADGSPLPPVTMLLLQIKNLVKERENSRTVFVSATPAAVLTAERDNWLVLYKQPYQNYIGVGIDHPAAVVVVPAIGENECKARERWSNNWNDRTKNTFLPAVTHAVNQFASAPNKADEYITQICLISLENRKVQQFRMGEAVQKQLIAIGKNNEIGMIVMNSDTKENSEETLADLIMAEKMAGHKKVIIIAGFMASRGVSFTDFSNKENMFEIVLQVHYTKKNFPLNSSMQNMRLFGPVRRTLPGNQPALICNHWADQDIKVNFAESYRIIRELAENDTAKLGRYNPQRPLTQPYNFRYLKQGWVPDRFIFQSTNEADWLPIVP